jgi:hypothetical protein
MKAVQVFINRELIKYIQREPSRHPKYVFDNDGGLVRFPEIQKGKVYFEGVRNIGSVYRSLPVMLRDQLSPYKSEEAALLVFYKNSPTKGYDIVTGVVILSAYHERLDVCDIGCMLATHIKNGGDVNDILSILAL